MPSSVLSQLGNKVQHALQAHTPRTSRTCGRPSHVPERALRRRRDADLARHREAFVTVLAEGVPTPLAATRLVPPDSLMDAVDEAARQGLIAAGALRRGTPRAVDRESAHEMITARLNGAADVVAGEPSAGPAALRCHHLHRNPAAEGRAGAEAVGHGEGLDEAEGRRRKRAGR